MPVSISRIANLMKDRKTRKIAVFVGAVVDDERLLDVPKLTVCALSFSEAAPTRILKAGGKYFLLTNSLYSDQGVTTLSFLRVLSNPEKLTLILEEPQEVTQLHTTEMP
eukprot:gene10826-13267_t